MEQKAIFAYSSGEASPGADYMAITELHNGAVLSIFSREADTRAPALAQMAMTDDALKGMIRLVGIYLGAKCPGITGPLTAKERSDLLNFASGMQVDLDVAQRLISAASTRGYSNGMEDADGSAEPFKQGTSWRTPEVENLAKQIYAGYEGAENHPWKEGGNSDKQEQARYAARDRLDKTVASAATARGDRTSDDI